MKTLIHILKEKKEIIDLALKQILPPEDTKPEIIHQAMRYSTESSGKRIRPALCLLTYEMFFKLNEPVIKTACSLELLHTYTLIHDDLPCMDNDDLRRGKATLHIAYPESIALLAGDALLTLAFQILAENAKDKTAFLVKELAVQSGSSGIIGGQVMDILSENTDISLADLEYIHLNKTAKLIETSITFGAILANATKTEKQALVDFGRTIGLAFQIADDILDETGSTKKMGKKAGQDQKLSKATYPKFFGIEKSKQILNSKIEEAKTYLQIFGTKAQNLSLIADYFNCREY